MGIDATGGAFGARRAPAAKYVMAAPLSGRHAQPGWHLAMQAAWGADFSDSADGRLALELVGGGMAPTTNSNYDSKARQFFEFCGSRTPVLNPLHVQETDLVEYVAWQGRRGRVRMTKKNFQPYLSSVNKFFKAVKVSAFAGGPVVTDAVAAAGRRQAAVGGGEAGRRTYLPAPVVLAILERAEDMVACLSGRFDEPAELLELLRPLLATVNGFLWFDRPHTTVGALWEDFGMDEDSLTFFERDVKTNRLGVLGTRSVVIPVFGGPEVDGPRRIRALLRTFVALKCKVCPHFARNGQRFWAIPGDVKMEVWTSAVQNSWLQTALHTVGRRPPENFSWTAYSLRHGAASAAAAIGAPPSKYHYIGGWTQDSDVPRQRYINPTCPATDAARTFFGFMQQTQ